jgi:protein-disulfide isomerase
MRFLNIALVVVAGLLGVLIGLVVANYSTSPDTMNDQQFTQRVREALVNEPDILRDAFNALDAQQRAAEMTALQDAITRNYSLIETAPAAFISGNPDGDVTIVEFFDYECGFCRRAQEPFQSFIADDGNIKVVYFELPILGETSYRASLAALAADRQGLYEEFHDAAVATSDRLTDDKIFEIAGEIGADVDQLRTDMADPEIANRVQANVQLAQAMTVNSTPTYVVGGKPALGWNADNMRTLVEEARARE